MKVENRRHIAHLAAQKAETHRHVSEAEGNDSGRVYVYTRSWEFDNDLLDTMRGMDYEVGGITGVNFGEPDSHIRVMFTPIFNDEPAQNLNPPCPNCEFSGLMPGDEQGTACPECGERL